MLKRRSFLDCRFFLNQELLYLKREVKKLNKLFYLLILSLYLHCFNL